MPYGNTTDRFGRKILAIPHNLPFSAKNYAAASRESKIELLKLVSDFMMIFRLKICKGISVESMAEMS